MSFLLCRWKPGWPDGKIIFQYLALWKNENWPNNVTNLPKEAQIRNNPSKFVKLANFAKSGHTDGNTKLCCNACITYEQS